MNYQSLPEEKIMHELDNKTGISMVSKISYSHRDLTIVYPAISVVMPALDEETTIGECITKIKDLFSTHRIEGEVIIADSSSDRTPEIASSLNAMVVYPKKPGYGQAYLEGFQHARFPNIVMMDADGTYDPMEILKLIVPIVNGADLVIGSRFKGTIKSGAMTPLHRYIGNPLLTWVLNAVFDTKFSDVHSGFRAIKSDALEKLNLKTNGMEFASEMLIMASKKGLKIEEVPISYYPRQAPSHLHSFADGWRHLRFVLLMDPIPFLTIPGIIFSLLGIFMMALFSFSGNIELSHLHSFILGAILLIGGVQLLVMGINTKVYSIVHGYDEKSGWINKFLNYHSLEKFLVFGGILILGGILIGLSIILYWINANFGEISQIFQGILSLLMIIIGIQVIFCSVFISMMILNEGELP